MIKRLEVTAIREDKYEIYIDDAIYNEAALKDYSKFFSKVESVEDLSKILSAKIMQQGSGNFFEGFGIVKTLHSNGMEKSQLYQGRFIKEEDYAPGILVKIIGEDEDYHLEVEAVK